MGTSMNLGRRRPLPSSTPDPAMHFNFHSGLSWSRKSRASRGRRNVRRASPLSLIIIHVLVGAGVLRVAPVLTAHSA